LNPDYFKNSDPNMTKIASQMVMPTMCKPKYCLIADGWYEVGISKRPKTGDYHI